LDRETYQEYRVFPRPVDQELQMSYSHPNNSAISAQPQLDYIEASNVLQK
jgi:hypothetical protein